MEIFFSGASCAAACSATGFSPGGAFFRQTPVPHIPLDLGMFLLRRGKGSAQFIDGNFSPSCHIFQGTFPSVLSWGLSCGGKLSAGRYGLPYSLPGRSFPGI